MGATVVLPTSSNIDDWSDEEKVLVEAAGLVAVKGTEKVLAPRPIVAKFRHAVERTGLDPLTGQIYCIGRFGQNGLEWSIQTGIDGFRVIAERSRQYAGQDAAEWLTKDHGWVDAFVKELHGDHPLAARVRAYRHDWERPAVGIATWDEYAQRKSGGALTKMWEQRGPGQLAKCAEALALRKLAPHDLSGIYTEDELARSAPAVEVEESKGPRSRVAQVRAAAEVVEDAVVVEEGESAAEGDAEAVDAPDGAGEADTAGDGRVEVAAGGSVDEVDPESLCMRCGKVPAVGGSAFCDPCEDAVEAEVAAAASEDGEQS